MADKYGVMYTALRMTEGKKVNVYIDMANIWSVYKSMKRVIDFKKFKEYIEKNHGQHTYSFYYYEAYPRDGTRKHSVKPKHNFHVFLRKSLGFIIKKKPLKRIQSIDTIGNISYFEKGNMDVEITADIILHNQRGNNTVIVCSGDSDFCSVLKIAKGFGNDIFVYSSQGSISEELRKLGVYKDLADISDIWGGTLKQKVR